MKTKPVVHIENWEWLSSKTLTGKVQDHPRFKQGTFIHTSLVISTDPQEGIVETINTIYVLGKKRTEPAETAEAIEA